MAYFSGFLFFGGTFGLTAAQPIVIVLAPADSGSGGGTTEHYPPIYPAWGRASILVHLHAVRMTAFGAPLCELRYGAVDFGDSNRFIVRQFRHGVGHPHFIETSPQV